MRYSQIKQHLQAYGIFRSRSTTINHAFASAIAPHDEYDETRIRSAIQDLGQNPDAELLCVYCGDLAETWDHIFATVKNSAFSGNGHRIGNLVPCCKSCNSKKGNKNWEVYLRLLYPEDENMQDRLASIRAYIDKYHIVDEVPSSLPDYQKLQSLRLQVLELLREADATAERIRSSASQNQSD